MSTTIKLVVCPDQKRPERQCKPASQLMGLVVSGALVPEDFHIVGILRTLGRTAAKPGAWYFVNGMSGRRLRSWLESDGWAIQCTENEAFIADLDLHYKTAAVTQIRRYTLLEVSRRLATAEGRAGLGITSEKAGGA